MSKSNGRKWEISSKSFLIYGFFTGKSVLRTASCKCKRILLPQIAIRSFCALIRLRKVFYRNGIQILYLPYFFTLLFREREFLPFFRQTAAACSSLFLFPAARIRQALALLQKSPFSSARISPVICTFLRSDLWSGSSFCFQQIFIPPLNLHLFTFCNRLPDSSRTMNTKSRLLPFKIGRFFWQKRREDAFSFMDAAIFIQLFQVYFQANSSPFQGFSAGQKSVCF